MITITWQNHIQSVVRLRVRGKHHPRRKHRLRDSKSTPGSFVVEPAEMTLVYRTGTSKYRLREFSEHQPPFFQDVFRQYYVAFTQTDVT